MEQTQGNNTNNNNKISELTIKQDVARKALPCKRRKEGETDKKGSFCQPELLMRQVAIIIRRQTTSDSK